jgi:hypothetical protein
MAPESMGLISTNSGSRPGRSRNPGVSCRTATTWFVAGLTGPGAAVLAYVAESPAGRVALSDELPGSVVRALLSVPS